MQKYLNQTKKREREMQEEEPMMKVSDSDDDGSLASELAEEEIFSRPQAG